jgi:hypothetical protein
MPAALQANEFGDIFQILAKNKLIPACQNRYRAYAQSAQPFPRIGIVRNIEGKEINAFFRKKLFRS